MKGKLIFDSHNAKIRIRKFAQLIVYEIVTIKEKTNTIR